MRPRTWQGREDQLLTHGVRKAVRLQVVQEVLLDPGQDEHDATAGEFATEFIDRVEGGDVDPDVGLGVEDESAHGVGLFVHAGDGAAVEVGRVGEEQW
jgi:hypothetical protein